MCTHLVITLLLPQRDREGGGLVLVRGPGAVCSAASSKEIDKVEQKRHGEKDFAPLSLLQCCPPVRARN